MINYDLPKSIFDNDGNEYAIRNNGDFRVVLDVISALKDAELSETQRSFVALSIFYKDGISGGDNPMDMECAVSEMMRFINLGEVDNEPQREAKAPLMDWEQDFPLLIAPLNKVFGCDIRGMAYLHWWTFVAAYQEIDENSLFAAVVRVRKKRRDGVPLDKAEQKFFSENKKIILLRNSLSQDDKDFLFGED